MTQEGGAGNVALQLSALDQRYLRLSGPDSAASNALARKLSEVQQDCEERMRLQVDAQVRCEPCQHVILCQCTPSRM
jgi:hypothetical protein